MHYGDAHEDIKQMIRGVGMPHEHDIVLVYPGGSYMSVIATNYFVDVGNESFICNTLIEAEKFLWEHWAYNNHYGGYHEQNTNNLG